MSWKDRMVLKYLGVQSAARRIAGRAAGDERGASTTEYALLLGLVVVVLITALTDLGDALTDKLQEIIDEIRGS